jgi:putative methyltransferase (TIGR04325 family)
MWVAVQNDGYLDVLDFGGSLGSTYFQNRNFLGSIKNLRWNIIEQSHYVKIGQADFEDDHLRFYADIDSCLADTSPNLVLLSGVLQCIEKPFSILDQILALPCDHIIIDRTPFWSGSNDRLCVQNVPPSIYPASYPCWIFSATLFHNFIENSGWQVIESFNSLDNLNAPVKTKWQGFILQSNRNRNH